MELSELRLTEERDRPKDNVNFCAAGSMRCGTSGSCDIHELIGDNWDQMTMLKE
jgi:hypothetical protein